MTPAHNPEWCPGSGVAGDVLELGHRIAPEDIRVAWGPGKIGGRGRRIYAATKRCRICTQTRSDHRKHSDLARALARAAINGHVGNFAELWQVDRDETRRRLRSHGWTIDAIAELYRAAIERGTCRTPDGDGGCDWRWDSGRHALSLDVCDPSSAPLLSNLQVICVTCNKRKRTMGLADWRHLCRAARAWRAAATSGPRQTEPPAIAGQLSLL